MLVPITGGCACRAVRYEVSTVPAFSGNCHCRDCQQATGSAFAPSMFVPSNMVKISGEVKYFETSGSSGLSVQRGFCPSCGSSLFGKAEAMPGMLGILAGSLDRPEEYRPSMDIFTRSAQPWDIMNPELPKFEGMPEK